MPFLPPNQQRQSTVLGSLTWIEIASLPQCFNGFSLVNLMSVYNVSDFFVYVQYTEITDRNGHKPSKLQLAKIEQAARVKQRQKQGS